MKDKGSAIIFCLGILGVLAIMGITFIRTANLERVASTSYEDTCRSKLVLQAGIEYSTMKLKEWVSAHAFDGGWGANDKWFYYKTSGGIQTSAAGTCVEDVSKGGSGVTASYNSTETPLDGRPFSGYVNTKHNTYLLKVLDCASQININVQYIQEIGLATDNIPLRAMLANLIKAVARDHSTCYPEANASAIANLIINTRNNRGGVFASKDDLANISYGSLLNAGKNGENFYNDIKDYVCTYSWQDNDQFWRTTHLNSITSPSNYQRLNPVSSTASSDFPLQKEARAPININTASRPVLIAVIAPLAGVAYNDSGVLETASIDYSTAEQIADQIISNRPYANINKFERIVDAINSLSDLQKDILKVNFNPNVWPNAINPTAVIYNTSGKAYCNYRIDKFHLRYPGLDGWSGHTTEFCLSSMGYFEIEVLARVMDERAVEKSSARATGVVKLYDVFRHTSQESFVNDPEVDTYTIPGASSVTYNPLENFISNQYMQMTGQSYIEGGVYTNGPIRMSGHATIHGVLTSAGGITISGAAAVDGGYGPGPTTDVPVLRPSDYKNTADYKFTSDGVFDKSGTQIWWWKKQGCPDSRYGDTFNGIKQKGNGEYQIEGDTTPPGGVYYFDGDFKITGHVGSSGTPWNASILAEGDVSIGGHPNIQAQNGVFLLSGGNIKITGHADLSDSEAEDDDSAVDPGAEGSYGGLIYAAGAFRISGHPVIEGTLVSANTTTPHGNPWGNANKISGHPQILRPSGQQTMITVPNRTGSGLKGDTLECYPAYRGFGSTFRSRYSGYLMLGTVRGADMTAVPGLIFRAGFDVLGDTAPYTPFDADPGSYGDKTVVKDPNSVDAGPYLTITDGEKAGNLAYPINKPIPLFHPGHLTQLLQDGYYADYNAVPAYNAVNNITGSIGTISLWFKPNWKATNTNNHHIFSLTRSKACFEVIHVGAGSPPSYSSNSLHFRFYSNGTMPIKIWRAWSGSMDQKIRLKGWNHLFIAYNMVGLNFSDVITAYLNGEQLTLDGSANAVNNNDPSPLTTNNPGIRLGEWPASAYAIMDDDPSNNLFFAASPEATYDEVITYPVFGGTPTPSSLFNIGRYYNHNNPIHTTDSTKKAKFTLLGSSRFSIQGRKIGTLSWTVYLPATKSCIGGSASNLLTGGEEWNVQFSMKAYTDTTQAQDAGLSVGTFLASTTGADQSDANNVIGNISRDYLGYDITIDHTFGSSVPILESPVIDDITITVMNRNSRSMVKSWSISR